MNPLPNIMKKQIVVPVDDSENAQRALDFAIEQANILQAKLFVIHVQPRLQTPNVKRFFSTEEIEEYSLELGASVLAQYDDKLNQSGVEFEKLIRIGSAKQEIADFSKDIRAYCIIMGSRGHGPIKGTVLGSVSYGVVHAAPCPVTIVP
ncbi:universal stress protein [Ornithinibacillus gellani]|uniref:universal stress protein n=1 Tax=Ornithinibacillus gellani TaxID=2293253 RepID=UPI000F48FCFC|nr:universal stress protein [Ornithinibacillus gellani]TQS72198.1 universal stress protein [Ornithinibacillus gellani]